SVYRHWTGTLLFRDRSEISALQWYIFTPLFTLPILSEHAVAVGALPPIYKDPFDRLLVAQAIVEGITLLTADARVAEYPGPVQLV
ncbi:type II toxin-antitoxin system VapC family toxin, partial [Nitrosomonas sp. Nm58]|uniref:type II toxin-antitoxin system VapC family toxin n=1 Tax=Nitrosomonas sp. Nm58 TaxID=200126 RepID=UPI0008965CAD